MGLPYEEESIRKSIGIPLKVQAPQWAGERAEEFRDRYRAIYRKLQEENMRLFPSTRDMLDAVKSRGYLTAVVTSKITRATQDALNHTGISDKFDAVITADDVAHHEHKPHPAPIFKALESLSVKSSEALYVGDSVFDVEAARQASVAMAAVTWGARSKADLVLECPHAVFDSWPEFVGWLGG